MIKTELSLWLKAIPNALLVTIGIAGLLYGMTELIMYSITAYIAACFIGLFILLLCGFRYPRKEDKPNA